MRHADRDARLRLFFAGYFNQDWKLDGAESWQDVLGQFLADNGHTDTAALRDSLISWSEEAKRENRASLPPEFGCDFDPHSDGLDDLQWIDKIADEFTRLLRE